MVEDGRKVARELDLVHQTLHKWIAKYKKDQEDSFVGSGNLSQNDKAEYKKDKQIRDLQEEVAILKKAMGIFAKKTRSNLRLHGEASTRVSCSKDVPGIGCF